MRFYAHIAIDFIVNYLHNLQPLAFLTISPERPSCVILASLRGDAPQKHFFLNNDAGRMKILPLIELDLCIRNLLLVLAYLDAFMS